MTFVADGATCFVAELVVWDPALPGTRVLRYATGNGFVSGPVAAVPNTYYDPRLVKAPLMRRDLFAPGATMGETQVGRGDLELSNEDGGLDGLQNYYFDGWPVTIWQGQRRVSPIRVLVARKSASDGGTPAAVARLIALGFNVTTNLTATLAECRNFDVIVIDCNVWTSAEHNVFIQSLLADGQQVLVAGNDTRNDAFWVVEGPNTGWTGAPTVGVTRKIGSHPIWAGVTTMPNDSDSGYHIFQTILGVQVLGDYTNDEGGIAVALLTDASGGRMLFVPKFQTGSDADVFFRNVVNFLADFPCNFTKVVSGTMQQAEVGTSRVIVKLRDRQAEFLIPLQPSKFAGTNVLPLGLEGVANDLKSKPKPICFGKVPNISLACVNSSKLIYQVSDPARFNGETMLEVAYGNGVWVAVGLNGKLFSSTDGKTWAPRASGTSGFLSAVFYARGLFLAGGLAGFLATSPDGITWTTQTSGFGADQLNAFAYGAGLYVAVGGSGKLYTSPTGVTWTVRTSGFSSSSINDIVFNPNLVLFIAVGAAGKLFTSPDGITWTTGTSSTILDIQTVCSSRTVVVYGGNTGACGSSTNGTSYTSRTSQFGSTIITSSTFGDGLFVLVGQSGVMSTSPDGTTWTLRTSQFGTSFISDVAYAPQADTFIIVGAEGLCAHSTNGTTWTLQLAITSVDAVYDKGVQLMTHNIVAVGSGGGSSRLCTSGDGGKTWTARTSTFGASIILDVVYAPSLTLWIIVGAAGKLATSPDGVTWTARTSGFGADTINSVAWSPALGIAVAVGDAGKIFTSTDGSTWTAAITNPFGGSDILNQVAWATEIGTFAIAAQGVTNDFATSTDGTHWTARAVPVANPQKVAWSPDFRIFIIGNSNPTAATSPDGITWTTRVIQATVYNVSAINITTLASISADAGSILVGGINGNYSVSTDGINWAHYVLGEWDTRQFGGFMWTGAQWMAMSGAGPTSNSGIALADRSAILWQTTVADAFTGFIMLKSAIAFITRTAYATLTALLDDTQAPTEGDFKAFLSEGLIRLGARPGGVITADVTEGLTAAERTAAQIFKRALHRFGKLPTDYLAADLTVLDAANDAELGYWTDAEVQASAVFDMIVNTVGAWWGVDYRGVFRIARVESPASGTEVMTLTQNDMLVPPKRIVANDPAGGLPTYQTVIRWGRMYTVQDASNLAGSVTLDRRNLVGKEWREAKATDVTVLVGHLLASQIVLDSLFTTETDAQDEASRRQTLRGTVRDRLEFKVPMRQDNRFADIGSIIKASHPRLGLVAGRKLEVIGVLPNGEDRSVTLTVWG